MNKYLLLLAAALAVLPAHAQLVPDGTQRILNSTNVNLGAADLTVGVNGGNTQLLFANSTVTNAHGALGQNSTSSSNIVAITDGISAWNNGGELRVGVSGAGNTLVIQNGGKVRNTVGNLGANVTSSNNQAIVTGAGSVWNNSSTLRLGQHGKFNSLVISSGGTVNDVEGSMGADADGGYNRATVTGSGSVWNNSGALHVGDYGGGNALVVTNGGTVNSATDSSVGLNPGASNNTATVTGSGSVWNNSGSVTLGLNGNGNALVVTNSGRVTSGSDLHVGSLASFNTLLIASGGTVSNTVGHVGSWAGSSNNTATVTGSGSVWNNSSAVFVGLDGGGNALVITNGGRVVSGSEVRVGENGSGNTLLLASGGTVSAVNSVVVGGNASSTNNRVTVDGGNLRATNASHNASFDIRRGTNTLNTGLIEADQFQMTLASGLFIFNGGTFAARNTSVNNGLPFTVGNGSSTASYILTGNGTHTFNKGLTLASNATLTGNGTLNGALTVTSGSTLSPGNSVGKIILNTPPVLAGSVVMEISKNGATLTNDQVQLTGGGMLTYGSALTVTKLGPTALAAGDRFVLFSASSYGGTFNSITLPSPGPGLAWTNKLLLDGSIEVVTLVHTLTVNPATNNAAAVAELINAISTTTNGTIELFTSGVYQLSATNNFWYGPNALPPIASAQTIEGNGATLLITNVTRLRFFYVGADPLSPGTLGFHTPGAGNLTLRNLTLSGGRQKGGDSNGGGGGAGMGGAIFNQGQLALDGVTLTDNHALGGNYNVAGVGDGGGGMGSDSDILDNGGGFGGSVTPAGSTGGAGGLDVGGGGGGGGGGFGTSDNGKDATVSAGGAGGGVADGLGGRGSNSGGTPGNSGFGSGGGSSSGVGGGGGDFGHGGFRRGGGGGIGGGGGNGGGGGIGGGGGDFAGGGGGFGGGNFSAGGGGQGFGASDRGGGAGFGGAIFNHGGRLNCTNSTFSANLAAGGGGAVVGGASGLGGAIFNLNGTVALYFSTLASNTVATGPSPDVKANAAGGAIYNLGYNAALTNPASITLANCLLANNSGGTDLANNAHTNLITEGFNNLTNISTARVTFTGPNFVTAMSNLNGGTISGPAPLTGNPLLGPLADNGGPTFTHALLPGSPALNAGVFIAGITTDQRGAPRDLPNTGGLLGNYYAVAGGTSPTLLAPLSNLESLTPAATVLTPRIDFGDGTESTPGDGTVLDRYSTTGNPFGGLGVNIGNDDIAALWSGFITVPENASYTFSTSSDDGSVLYVDGALVVDNNFNQGMTRRSGTVSLSAGPHTIQIGYFERGGGAGMQASWEQLTGAAPFARQVIPPSVLGLAASNSAPDIGAYEEQATGPVLTCAPDVVTNAPPGACAVEVFFQTIATGDPAPVVTYTLNGLPISSPHSFSVGTNLVTSTATNLAGTNVCQFAVIVRDVVAPVLNCLDLAASTPPGSSTVVVNFSPQASDDCSGVASLICVPPSGTAFSVGTNVVTCTAVDGAGNTNTCSFNVAVTAVPAFAESVAGLPGGLPGVSDGALAWGDYDGDGRLDLFLSGETVNQFTRISRIYHNPDGTNLVALNLTLPGLHFNAAAWADYDLDGDLDLLLTGDNGVPFTQLYRNNGGGSFTPVATGLPGLVSSTAAWGDFDHDGRPDLLLCGSADGATAQTRLYRNCGDGGFTAVGANLPDVLLASAAWADFDRDGILDLALMGFDGVQDVAGIYRGHGDGTFTEVGGLGFGFSVGAVAWGDFNNDGYPDVIFTGESDTLARTVLYRNELAPGGGRQFTPVANTRLPDLKESSVAWGDFDNDGRLDVLIAGATRLFTPARQAGIYVNNGAGEFNILSAAVPAVEHGRVACADFNRDGRLDLLVAGYTGTNRVTRLLLNSVPVNNTAPAAPSGLSATLTTNGMVLAWATATDGQTPVAGLSYNLRLTGPPERPGVVSPAALADGTRLLPGTGNAGSGTSWLQRHLTLPTGLYTWSVQAIDSAFTGSAFSTNGTFYIQQPSYSFRGVGEDGHYQLEFSGTNVAYHVEVTPNLLDCGFSVWTRLGDPAANGPGQFQFRDPEAATGPRRFYRLVWP